MTNSNTPKNKVTHGVLKFIRDKPVGYYSQLGRTSKIASNHRGWQKGKRIFSFSNLPTNNSLEFTFREFPEMKRVTYELMVLQQYDDLGLHDVNESITYKGEGLLMADVSRITPFISVFRKLEAKNKETTGVLLSANSPRADRVLQSELKDCFGEVIAYVLSDEPVINSHLVGITEGFLKENKTTFCQQYYVYGWSPMKNDEENQLIQFEANKNHLTNIIF
jgi:ferredoxin-NADP reductase